MANLFEHGFEIFSNAPFWVVRLHLAEVGDVADMVAPAVFIHVLVSHLLAGGFGDEIKSLKDGDGIFPTSSQVIHLGWTGALNELVHELDDVVGMNVIAYLLTLVAEYFVSAPFQIAEDEVTEKAMQLDPRVVRTGQASCAQTTGGHLEVPPVLLHHHIGSHFGGAKNGVH